MRSSKPTSRPRTHQTAIDEAQPSARGDGKRKNDGSKRRLDPSLKEGGCGELCSKKSTGGKALWMILTAPFHATLEPRISSAAVTRRRPRYPDSGAPA